MTHVLTLSCLGGFQVALEGYPSLQFPTDKTRALLIYLAVEASRVHERHRLASLLWPDMPEQTALRNLSKTLERLRQALPAPPSGSPYLLITRQTVQFNPASAYTLDVTEFNRRVASGSIPDLRAAAALYRGGFLTGFPSVQSTLFEEWVLLTGETLHRQALDALCRLAMHDEQQGEYETAGRYAQRQLELEPWREEAHQQMMRVLALRGQRSAALAHYNVCRQVLADELGIEPSVETQTLFERIRAGDLAPRVLTAPPSQHNLPTYLTPFVGRERELAEISGLWQAANVRLLTLVGVGGMGKTRLALEAARTQLDAFPDGVFLVSLAPLADAASIPLTIATSLGLTLYGEPHAALLRYLRPRRLLLILDNFEHLLPSSVPPEFGGDARGGVGLVVDLLEGAPQVHILATSRERLNVRGEHVYLVEAMDWADTTRLAEAASSSAVRLFVQSARRVQSDFVLSETNLADVVRICQRVRGMPLALELAAAWVEVLPLAEIAAEIERSADFLAHDWRDTPERQRSLRAVFDWSWRLLTDAERAVYQRLTVFRGGFTREAAQVVVGASLRTLTSLVHKSLVSWGQAKGAVGRYEMHELLREFAAEPFDAAPEQRAVIEAQHSRFYLHYVAQRETRLTRHEPRQAAEEIQDEIDNIRTAWLWATRHAISHALDSAVYGLWQFYVLTGSSAASEQLFQRAIQAIETNAKPADPNPVDANYEQRVLSKLLALSASALISRNKYDAALEVARRAVALGQASGGLEGEAFGYYLWGQALYRQGLYTAARPYLEQASRLAHIYLVDQPSSEVLREAEWLPHIFLRGIFLAEGEIDRARTTVLHALDLCRAWGKLRGETLCLANLASIAYLERDYAAARQYYEQALPLARSLGYRWGEAVCQLELAWVMRSLGEYSVALDLAEGALAVAREIGDEFIQTITVAFFARLYIHLGHHVRARAWLDQLTELMRRVSAYEAQYAAWFSLALHAQLTGDDKQALTYAMQGLHIAQEKGDQPNQAEVLVLAGHAYARLGQFAEARLAYQQALRHYAALGRPFLGVEAQAGLAAVALGHQALDQARSHVQDILTVLDDSPRIGLDDPCLVYLTCYRVLDGTKDPRAMTLLQAAYDRLQEDARRMADPLLRESFLENVAVHREVRQAYVDRMAQRVNPDAPAF